MADKSWHNSQTETLEVMYDVASAEVQERQKEFKKEQSQLSLNLKLLAENFKTIQSNFFEQIHDEITLVIDIANK